LGGIVKTRASKNGPLRPADGLEKTLVSSTIRLLKEKTASDITFRQIAEEAGVSHMAPYRYFKNKHDIFYKIAEIGFERLAVELEKAIAEFPLDIEKQGYAAARNYFRFASEQAEYFEVMYGPSPINPSELVDKVPAVKRTLDVLMRVINNCQLVGLLPKNGNAEKFAVILWSTVHGYTVLYLNNSFLKIADPEQMIDSAVRSILKGLSA
jgi:AcrR family transcriptional regulator